MSQNNESLFLLFKESNIDGFVGAIGAIIYIC